jgi:hypothetical protein
MLLRGEYEPAVVDLGSVGLVVMVVVVLSAIARPIPSQRHRGGACHARIQ